MLIPIFLTFKYNNNMNKTFSTEALISSLKSNKMIQHSNIPMGYVPGLPVISILNGNLCMRVPYLKYKVTGEVDKTLVYPIKFVVTISIPEETIVGIEDLSFNTTFGNIEFNNPVGLFRHDAIKTMDKTAYSNLRKALYIEYDKIVAFFIGNREYTSDDEDNFRSLFNVILEPSLHPFYMAIDNDFSNKYLISEK